MVPRIMKFRLLIERTEVKWKPFLLNFVACFVLRCKDSWELKLQGEISESISAFFEVGDYDVLPVCQSARRF